MRLSEPITKNWMKINPHQRWRCSRMTSTILAVWGLCWYSRGFPGEGASNNSVVIENVDFGAFGCYVFGKWGNEDNIITVCSIILSLVAFPLTWNTWPCKAFNVQFSIFTITNRISAIGLHIYRTATYKIFLLYDVISRDVQKRTVKTVILRILWLRVK